jgi:hypothetical protein
MLGPEALLQISYFEWLQYFNREAYECTYAIPNGGTRNYLEAVNLKKQGVKAGVPDICIALPNKTHHGLYIEFKWGKNKTTQDQSEWLARLAKNYYMVSVCYTIDEAIDITTAYLKNR